MRPIPIFIVGILLVLLLNNACKEELAPASDFGYEYYPLDIGRYWEYRQDTVIFDPDIGMVRKDSSSSFVREEIVDTLRDNTGALLYRLEHYERAADSLPWQINGVYTLGRNEQQAIRTEDNLRFIKLVFPPNIFKQWNGNASFDEFLEVSVAGESVEMFKGWSYSITNSDTTLQLGDFSFDKVVKVQPSDYESFIELRSVQEYYAPEVGLVYRELWILDTQCEYCCNFNGDLCDMFSWDEKAEAGFILRQQLIDYQ
ncbi:MAG: hypothetical protein DHS20C18_14540 [Saprospiraceae bacterium]|nr:MAG: hypothetical protein DHS20C18_14540 [Saprospiraceae bacterium]